MVLVFNLNGSVTVFGMSSVVSCPSLAVRPWSQQPAQNQDYGQESGETKFDRYPHINLVPFILETTGRPGPHAGNSSTTYCEMLTTHQ